MGIPVAAIVPIDGSGNRQAGRSLPRRQAIRTLAPDSPYAYPSSCMIRAN